MVYITICDEDAEIRDRLELDIHKYLIGKRIGLGFQNYDSIFDIQDGLKYDVYFVHVTKKEEMQKLEEIKLEHPEVEMVILADSNEFLLDAIDLGSEGYLFRPDDKARLPRVVDKIYRNMREKVAAVLTKGGGMRRIRTSQLNYVNIEGRNLCYHMADGEEIYGPALRASFEKSVGEAVMLNSRYVFLKPSVLVNIDQIKSLEDGCIKFCNGDFIFVSKTQWNILNAALAEKA